MALVQLDGARFGVAAQRTKPGSAGNHSTGTGRGFEAMAKAGSQTAHKPAQKQCGACMTKMPAPKPDLTDLHRHMLERIAAEQCLNPAGTRMDRLESYISTNPDDPAEGGQTRSGRLITAE
ncbi:hypothetical protein [Nitratireductor pacificus]|uniref:hypothetical protein n=1 Tax=Nitratireductor pacificus TaxID=1231180 RepID=UPI0012F67B04|nr:hypothetical protein [Nitratireductor pacificus]